MNLDYSMEHPPLTHSFNPNYRPVVSSTYESRSSSSSDLSYSSVSPPVNPQFPKNRTFPRIPATFGVQHTLSYPVHASLKPPVKPEMSTSGVQCLWETPHKKICSTWHQSSDDLAAHINSFHIPTQESVVCHWKGCDRDGKPFKRKSLLLNHLRVHTGETPFKCDVCQKRFARAANLKIHGRIHTGEKPFLCKVEGCLKRFSESTVRIKHMRTHVEKTQFFECKQCDKKYGHLDALKKHIKNKHKAEAPGTSGSGTLLTDTSNVRQGPVLEEQSSSNTPSYSQVDYSGFYTHRDQMYIYPQNNYEY